MADHLGEHLGGIADPKLAGIVQGHIEELISTASALRSMSLVFDANRADALAKREQEIRSIASTVTESIRGLAEVHRIFSQEMGEEITELDSLADIPADEELVKRLRRAVAHMGETAQSLGHQMKSAAANAGMANLRIATLERELDEARDRAMHDGLTRLYSRAALDDRLRAAILRGNSEGPWCFLIGDLDHFKRVNDEYGHVAGDALLSKVARLLEDSLRREDEIGFIARYGGEEFGIIAPGTSLAQAGRVGDRIRASVEAAEWEVGDADVRGTVCLTISIGVGEYTVGDSSEMLIKRADGALYGAKQSGRNRVVLAED